MLQKLRLIETLGFASLGIAFGSLFAWYWASAGLPKISAQDTQSPGGAKVLPLPDPPFKGVMGKTVKESKEDFPQPI